MVILYVVVGMLVTLSLGLCAMFFILKSKKRKYKLRKSKNWEPCMVLPKPKARASFILFSTVIAQNKSLIHLMLLGQAKFAYNQTHERP